LAAKAQALIKILTHDPFQRPPNYEKLVGNLSGAYSRRINIQHRLVYQVDELERFDRSCLSKSDTLPLIDITRIDTSMITGLL